MTLNSILEQGPQYSEVVEIVKIEITSLKTQPTTKEPAKTFKSVKTRMRGSF